MNSRSEGQYLAPTKEQVLQTIDKWVDEEDIEEGDIEKSDTRLSYWASDGMILQEYHHIYTETDTLERVRADIIYDDKVTQYIDIDKIANFVYNCIDVNSLAVVNKLVLLYDEEDTYKTKARKEMVDLTGDEYGYEIGDGDLLGVNWVERSMVVIRVDNILKESQKVADEIARDMYVDYKDDDWKEYFEEIFQEGVLQTLCHEYRHCIFELNYIAVNDDKEFGDYPEEEGLEENVEEYGNSEALKFLHDKKLNVGEYINGLIKPNIVNVYEEEIKSHSEQDKDEIDR